MLEKNSELFFFSQNIKLDKIIYGEYEKLWLKQQASAKLEICTPAVQQISGQLKFKYF